MRTSWTTLALLVACGGDGSDDATADTGPTAADIPCGDDTCGADEYCDRFVPGMPDATPTESCQPMGACADATDLCTCVGATDTEGERRCATYAP